MTDTVFNRILFFYTLRFFKNLVGSSFCKENLNAPVVKSNVFFFSFVISYVIFMLRNTFAI